MCIFYFPLYLYHHTRLCKRKIGRHIANENSANKNQGFYQTKYHFQVLVIDYLGQFNHSFVTQKYPIYLTFKVYKITKETKTLSTLTAKYDMKSKKAAYLIMTYRSLRRNRA